MPPGPQYRRGVDIQVIGEQPGRPVRDTEPRRGRGEGSGEDSGPIHRPRPTRPLLIAQALQPGGGIAVPPGDYRRPRHTDPLSDLGVGHPIGGQQHDPRTLRQTGPDRARPGPRLQQLTITRSKAQRLRAHPSFSRTPLSNYFRRAALGQRLPGRSEAGQSRSLAPTTAICSAKRWAGSAGSVPVKVFTLASR